MTRRQSRLATRLVAILLLAVASHCCVARADIYRWDNWAVIPGTEGIEPGPGVRLRNRKLEFADLSDANLMGAQFDRATLTSANLRQANLAQASFSGAGLMNADLSNAVVAGTSFGETTARGFTQEQLYSTASYKGKDLQGIGLWENDLSGWNFAGQNLVQANFGGARLLNAVLSDAVVTGTNFGQTTTRGFTQEQLYSTASYKSGNLAGIGLWENDLSGWNFTGQNLAGSYYTRAMLTSANLSQTNLADAEFWWSTLTNADFTDAVVNGAEFVGGAVDGAGLTADQLYATKSYKGKDLAEIQLLTYDLSGWNFVGQNLEGADFFDSKLADADFTDAIIRGAYFGFTGFTTQQLHTTASYKDKDLTGTGLWTCDLSAANLAGQNLAGATFSGSLLEGADFTDAVVTGADFSLTILGGFTKEQLYSTASYKSMDLQGIVLSGADMDLAGWDFRGQNLAGANFANAVLTNAHFARANLAGVSFDNATIANTDLSQLNLMDADFAGAVMGNADLTGADLRGAPTTNNLLGVFTRNMISPDGSITGVDLRSKELLIVRDDDGVPDPAPHHWLRPRRPIAVAMQDQVAMADGSVLQLHFDADPWDSLISFEPGIPVQLGGTLELTFADDMDVTTQVGRTLDIFDWTGVEPTGAFTVASPYLWDLTYLYITGEVRLTGTGIVADYDGSGLVEQGDLDLLLLNWGADATTPPAGWINDLPIGLVDQTELDKVLLNWGSAAVSLSKAALVSPGVPEPASRALAILLSGLAMMPLKRKILDPVQPLIRIRRLGN